MPVDFLVQNTEARLATNTTKRVEVKVSTQDERDEIVKYFDSNTYNVVSRRVEGGYKLIISAKV